METVQTTIETKELVRQTIREFAKENNFTNISPKVNTNTNGYPFLVFTNPSDKGMVMFIYFSKNAAKMVAKDQPVTKQLLDSVQVAETRNAKGEERFKLVTANGLDIEELLGE